MEDDDKRVKGRLVENYPILSDDDLEEMVEYFYPEEIYDQIFDNDSAEEIAEEVINRWEREFYRQFPDGRPLPENPDDVRKIKEYSKLILSEMAYQENVAIQPDVTFYRARYDQFSEIEAISQYGYIPDNLRHIIKRLRYNEPQQQVLYTASEPFYAFQEIKYPEANCDSFYLSVWKLKQPLKIFSFIPSDGETAKGLVKELYRVQELIGFRMMGYFVCLSFLGSLLESPKDGDINRGYLFSSAIASEVFKYNDAIITVSQKSDNSGLNVTFNCNAYDYVEMKTVYHCECPVSDEKISLFKIDRIGKVEDGKVKWYSYEIDTNTITHIKRDHYEPFEICRSDDGDTIVTATFEGIGEYDTESSFAQHMLEKDPDFKDFELNYIAMSPNESTDDLYDFVMCVDEDYFYHFSAKIRLKALRS